ncbi:uncharacterized protein LOC124927676 [Impatiens glandulifera]|uniref:uncharacterized protein LOC124927676 n=1 Tax=Impatiens glandulifera TaxID=253017 RepID=UPI001FB07847|nr:uncharacterized protein LOC124927676 [Impatiens glandulifera]
MEALYSKLYDKYSKLKVKKECEIEKIVRDQDVKFMKYISDGDELIEHLRKENEELHAQVVELRNELASIRSSNDEQYAEHQKIIMEENQKSKKLSEEIEKLQKFQLMAVNSASQDIVNTEQSNKRKISLVESDGLTIHETSKRSRHDSIDQLIENENDFANQTTPCHTEDKCLFRNLLELLVGMKLSNVDRTDEMSMSVTHQSSGYSFRLTWIDDETDGEVKLLYEALSLGTFERVAPEWMREIIVFSTRMCPVFFERLSRVIKLYV